MDEWMDTYGCSAKVPEFAILVAASTLAKTQIYNYMSTRRKRDNWKTSKPAKISRRARFSTRKKVAVKTPVSSVNLIPSPHTNFFHSQDSAIDVRLLHGHNEPRLVNRYMFSMAPGVVFFNPWDVFDTGLRCALAVQQRQRSVR